MITIFVFSGQSISVILKFSIRPLSNFPCVKRSGGTEKQFQNSVKTVNDENTKKDFHGEQT
jgi:hypothetical protein